MPTTSLRIIRLSWIMALSVCTFSSPLSNRAAAAVSPFKQQLDAMTALATQSELKAQADLERAAWWDTYTRELEEQIRRATSEVQRMTFQVLLRGYRACGEELRSRAEYWMGQANEYRKTAEELQKQLDGTRNENAALKDRISKLEKQIEDMQRDHEGAMAAAQDRIDQLEGRLKQVRARIRSGLDPSKKAALDTLVPILREGDAPGVLKVLRPLLRMRLTQYRCDWKRKGQPYGQRDGDRIRISITLLNTDGTLGDEVERAEITRTGRWEVVPPEEVKTYRLCGSLGDLFGWTFRGQYVYELGAYDFAALRIPRLATGARMRVEARPLSGSRDTESEAWDVTLRSGECYTIERSFKGTDIRPGLTLPAGIR